MTISVGSVVVFCPSGGRIHAAKKGATAWFVKEDKLYFHVKWDRNNPLHNHQMDGAYCKKDFQFASPPSKPEDLL